jgi:hypothetical protein
MAARGYICPQLGPCAAIVPSLPPPGVGVSVRGATLHTACCHWELRSRGGSGEQPAGTRSSLSGDLVWAGPAGARAGGALEC